MSDMSASGEPADRTRALLAEVWARNLPIVTARLELLDQAARTLPLPEKLRIEAGDVAHKLAGSLGMFGFAEGTRISRQLELLLDTPYPDSLQITVLTRRLRQELFPA